MGPWRGRHTGADRDEPGSCAAPVRQHEHLPLPVRPGHDRALASWSRCSRPRGTAAGRRVPPADPVLRRAPRDQHRGRRGDGTGPGVPVRHELVGLLDGSSATCSARRSRSRGWRAFFLESTFLGCGCSAGGGSPSGCTSPRSGRVALGAALSAAFIMAANSWMQHPVGYTVDNGKARAHEHLGGADEPGVRVGLPPRAAGLAGHRRHASCSPCRLAPPARLAARDVPADGLAVARRCSCRRRCSR